MTEESVPRSGAGEAGSRFNFGVMARTYDRWYDTPAGRAYDRLEKHAVEKLLPPRSAGARLLEVGCGTGHWSTFFSAHGFEVVGVDLAPEMISAAAGKRIANAAFHVADAHSLPFDDGSFDVTAAIATIEFVRDAQVVLEEMARCTRRPGGAMVVGTLNALAPINRRRKDLTRPPYAMARFFRPGEVRKLLASCGEAQVRVCAFGAAVRLPIGLGALADRLAATLRLRSGAFIAGRATL